MADTKISSLPNASTLGGTEQLAGVQSGSNVNITPAQIKTFTSAAPTIVGRLTADSLLVSSAGTSPTSNGWVNGRLDYTNAFIASGDWSAHGAVGTAIDFEIDGIDVAPPDVSCLAVYLENDTSVNCNDEACLRVFGSGFGSATAIGSGLKIEAPYRFPLDYAAIRILDQGTTKYVIKGGTGLYSFNGPLTVTTVKTTPVNLSALPSASTAGMGTRAFINDGSTTLILGLGLTAVGSGSNKVPVYSDGTNWIVG